MSESFEKMIFQAAFKIYEVFPNQLDFGVSIAGLKEKIQPDKVHTTLEALCLKYGLSKLWISDNKWYMARGENINFGVCCDIAMYGRITGEDKERINVFKMKIWNLKIDTGKRDDSQQYQLVNCDDEFSEDFDSRINSPERLLGKLRELEVHVISGRKDIEKLFKVIDKNPEWIQNPEWQFNNGKPMKFIGQLDIKKNKIGLHELLNS